MVDVVNYVVEQTMYAKRRVRAFWLLSTVNFPGKTENIEVNVDFKAHFRNLESMHT